MTKINSTSKLRVILSYLKLSYALPEGVVGEYLTALIKLLSEWGVSGLPSVRAKYSDEECLAIFKAVQDLGVDFISEYMHDIKSSREDLETQIEDNSFGASGPKGSNLSDLSLKYHQRYRLYENDLKDISSDTNNNDTAQTKEIEDLLKEVLSDQDTNLYYIRVDHNKQEKEHANWLLEREREQKEKEQRSKGLDPDSLKHLKQLGGQFPKAPRRPIKHKVAIFGDDRDDEVDDPFSWHRLPLKRKLQTTYDKYKKDLEDFIKLTQDIKQIYSFMAESEAKIKPIKDKYSALEHQFEKAKETLEDYVRYLYDNVKDGARAKHREGKELTPYEKLVWDSSFTNDLQDRLKRIYLS